MVDLILGPAVFTLFVWLLVLAVLGVFLRILWLVLTQGEDEPPDAPSGPPGEPP